MSDLLSITEKQLKEKGFGWRCHCLKHPNLSDVLLYPVFNGDKEFTFNSVKIKKGEYFVGEVESIEELHNLIKKETGITI